jgi:hypothetical protein
MKLHLTASVKVQAGFSKEQIDYTNSFAEHKGAEFNYDDPKLLWGGSRYYILKTPIKSKKYGLTRFVFDTGFGGRKVSPTGQMSGDGTMDVHPAKEAYGEFDRDQTLTIEDETCKSLPIRHTYHAPQDLSPYKKPYSGPKLLKAKLEICEANTDAYAATLYFPLGTTANQAKHYLVSVDGNLGLELGVDIDDVFFSVKQTKKQPKNSVRFQADPSV